MTNNVDIVQAQAIASENDKLVRALALKQLAFAESCNDRHLQVLALALLTIANEDS
jgi:hypothetical protein